MVHSLKILPEYLSEVRSGKKTFELRRNDRNFRPGDYLALNEWDGEAYTGRCELVELIYMLNPNDVMPCEAGFAILSIKRFLSLDRIDGV